MNHEGRTSLKPLVAKGHLPYRLAPPSTNLIWHVSENLTAGFGVTWWRTLYHEERIGLIPTSLLTPSGPGEAVTLEWMVRLDY